MTDGPRLLIRLGSLGDVVLATAAASAAGARWGNGSLDVLVKEEWAAVWDGHPVVRRLWSWSRKDRGPGGVLRLARRLAGQGYLEVVDLQGSVRTRALAVAAGWRRVRRPRRHELRRRALARWRRWGPPPGFRMVQSFVDAVEPGGAARPVVRPSAEARTRAAERCEAAGPVGLVPGARHATKRWPSERYVAVGKWLAGTYGGSVAVFFGPDEDGLRAEWRRLWPQEDEWLPVQDELPLVAACLERLHGVVTNDTGLMHLAEAVGTPVVALFGPTTPRFGFAPVHPESRVLEVKDLGCRPCSIHGSPRCPRGHFRCMMELDEDLVREAATALVPAPGDGRARGESAFSARRETHA